MEPSHITYLVDLENIGPAELYAHAGKHPADRYIIFYSAHTASPEAILEQMPAASDVRFRYCPAGTDNAMDFCICAVAGRLSAQGRNVLRIFSDDRDYDPVLPLLQEEGVRIAREGTTRKTDGAENGRSTPLIEAVRSCVPKQYQAEVASALRRAADRRQAHDALQDILPQKFVPEVYNKLKKYIPKERK